MQLKYSQVKKTFFFLETGGISNSVGWPETYCTAKDDLELLNRLSLPLECWNFIGLSCHTRFIEC